VSLAALAALVPAGGGVTATAAPPPRDGVVDLLTDANAEIIGSPGVQIATGGGDLNGDGRGDILVGSPSAGSVSALAGRVQPVDVDLAAPGRLAFARIDGAAPSDGFGFSVAGVGDVNGDGTADILAGAP
jgi:hypothetical protein